MSNFITDCINGDALTEDVYDYIDSWHEKKSELELHEFLGMTIKEYQLFMLDDNYLGIIISAHKDNKDVDDIVRDEIAMAARSDNQEKSAALKRWLESEGLWE